VTTRQDTSVREDTERQAMVHAPSTLGGNGRDTASRGDSAFDAVLHNTTDLLLSLILPLPDHRGLAGRSIQSWAIEQTLPRDRYELIVLTDGSQPAVEAEVAALLAPHDRMIALPAGNEAQFYSAGADAARGRWLFFSEAHVLGAPDCLEQVVRALLATGADGVACRSEGICLNAFARCEEGAFERVSRMRLAPDHWSRLFLRGSAVSRQVFHDVGGLNSAYGLFAEPHLAARLHTRGHSIAYAPDALVRHLNTSNVAELRDSIHSYITGECAYRLEHPGSEGDAYFGTPSWWVRRARLDPAVDRSLCQSLGRSLFAPSPGWRGRAKRWLALLPSAVVGTRAHLWQADLKVLRAAIRCWWWRNQENRLMPTFQDLYSSLAEQAAVQALASAAESSGAAWAIGDSTYEVADLPDGWMTGFHLVEQYGGERFRWSGPIASLKLPLDGQDRILRLRTRGLRQRPRVQAYLNGRRLALHDCQAEHGEIRLMPGPRHVVPGRFQHLVLLCEPLRPWLHGVPDRRELGLPLFEIVRVRNGSC
jgi:hypothetical protein